MTADALTADSPLTEIRGVGVKTAELFQKKNLYRVRDLLQYYPRSYDFFPAPALISDSTVGGMAVLKVCFIGSGSVFHSRGKSVTYFYAGDASGKLRLTWFNQPYLRKALPAGSIRIVRGLLRQSQNGNLYMEQPRIFRTEEYEKLQGSFQPLYPLTEGLKSGTIIRTMHSALDQIDFHAGAPGEPGTEYLSDELLQEENLLPEEDAIRQIHFPEDQKHGAAARRRLAFDEFFRFLLSVQKNRTREQSSDNPHPMLESAAPGRLIEQLPYELTDDQKQAWEEIRNDLCSTHIMNRLLQGDVGSGKTILAFLSLLLTASNGRQGALMAPTEVLAEQHMRNLQEMNRRYHLNLHPVLLTGSVKGAARREVYDSIRDGSADVILGTHALIQETVVYHNLGLVITDEQHRFGVRQREAFAGKGENVPILVMSATPIPRTLAIILYGDLRVSLLKEMPKNRLPIRNTVLDESWRERAYHFLVQQVRSGHQAYVVCPAVEKSETEELRNVEDTTAELREKLPGDLVIESLHGRMKSADKERLMNRFADHSIDILVSTTVIEVGINVPNATVMLIENAERFGLAQLHQLRGRVGRGKDQSYCIFMYGGGLRKPERLEVLEHSNDGFYIAEQDLKIRGPGDLMGIRQSGELGFTLADIYQDADLLRDADALIRRILREDPELSHPEHSRIRRYLDSAQANQVDFRSI